jgi:hypothetical protein
MSQRKLILAMQMTLDGFVEGPNGEMDWLIGSDDVWNEMFKEVDRCPANAIGTRNTQVPVLKYAGYIKFM